MDPLTGYTIDAFGYLPGFLLAIPLALIPLAIMYFAIAKLRKQGVITGGMVPKLETCVNAVEAGCEAAVILDGRVPHAMLLEFFTARGAGTLVRA